MPKKTSFVIHIALLLFIYPLLYIQTARSSLGSTDIPNLENGPTKTNLPSINEIPSTETPFTTTVNPLTFSRSLDPLIEYGIAPGYKSHNITIYRHVTQYLKGEKKLYIPIPSLLAINKHTLNLFQLHYESFVHSSLKLYLVPSLNIFSLAEKDIQIPYDIIESGIVNKLISIYPSTIDQNTAPQTTQQNNVLELTVKQPSLPYAPLNFEQYTIKPLNITAILDHLLDELNDRDYILSKQKDIKDALTDVEINIKNIKDMKNNKAKAFVAKLVPEYLNDCSLEILEMLGNTFEAFFIKKKDKKVMFQKNKDALVESLKKLKDVDPSVGSDKSNDVTTKANTKQSELSNRIDETEISIRAHEKCIKRYNQKLKAILEYKQPLDILNASVKKIKMTLQEFNHLKYFSDINFLLTVPKAIKKIDKIKEDLIKTDKNRLLLCLFLDSIASYKFEIYEHCLMKNNPDSVTADNLNNHIIFNRKYYDVYKYLWSYFPLTSTTYDKNEQEEICTFFHCKIRDYPELQIPLIKRKQSAIFADCFTQGNIFDLFKTENPRFNFVLNVIRFDQWTWWISDWKTNFPNMKFTLTMSDTRNYLKEFVNTYQKVAPLVAPLKDDSSSSEKNPDNNAIAKSEPQEHTPKIATPSKQYEFNDVHPEKNTSSDIIQNKKIVFYNSHMNIDFIRFCERNLKK